MRAILIRGVCSLCAAGVKGAGADEFEALGSAEAEHFAATDCRGEPVEIKKGVRQSDGREVFPKKKPFSVAAMALCGCPEGRHALGLPCPPPLPAPNLSPWKGFAGPDLGGLEGTGR